MTSVIAKFFMTLFTVMIANRIIMTILGIVIGFLLYKYITDPRYIANLLNTIKEFFGNLGSSKSEEIKQTVALLF